MLNRKIMGLTTALFLSASLTQAPQAAPYPYDMGVVVNGETLNLDPGVYNENSRSLVPLVQICDAIGADVTWVDWNKSIFIRYNNTVMSMQIGYDYVVALTNGSLEYIKLDTAPQVLENRTYIPLSAVTMALGAEVLWINETVTADITMTPSTGSNTTAVAPLLPQQLFDIIPTKPILSRENAQTTGSVLVDFMLDTILGEILTEEMTVEEELRAAYQYVAENYDHIYEFYSLPKPDGYSDYEVGGWGTYGSLAYDALYTRIGVCPHISALFASMSLRMGYPTYMINGEYINRNGSTIQHHWVVIELDGVEYHFDPDIESIFRVHYGWPQTDFDKFMLDVEASKEFHKWNEANPEKYGV